jgi:hypothetical protein
MSSSASIPRDPPFFDIPPTPPQKDDTRPAQRTVTSNSQSYRGWVFLKKNHRYIPIVSTITGLWETVKQVLLAIALLIAAPPVFGAYLVTRITGSEKHKMLGEIALGSALGSVECMGKAFAAAISSIPIAGNIIAYAVDAATAPNNPSA